MSDKRNEMQQANNLLAVIWDTDERRTMVTTFLNENLSATLQALITVCLFKMLI